MTRSTTGPGAAPEGAAPPPATGPRVVVSGAGVRYGDLTVFDGIDLTIQDREIVSIVGPSGCGKTTLLRSVDGLTRLNSGSVTIDGRPVEGPTPGVSMVFQHFGLFPWKNVYNNVAYGLKLAKAPKERIAEVVPEYIDMVGLAGFEKSYPHQLSGGMQQRAGLARALAVEPQVLLMDEPFSAIDAQTREVLQFELLRIWETRPIAMMFVTHSIEEAVLMGDRVVVLKGRPSHIHEVIDVGIPHPRTRATLKSARFQEVTAHVWDLLMQDVIAAEREVG
ncbi:NitT/TauT family transport system ATP-binding protein [Geodermatophilus africanus]|uniref:NitT/TauT family transport system ATP-binding protein n=1 Tax=Geodermatophilus africanus TaxID=1137993 RepID=A0A1H3EY19_9ACTN|nr:ABC transporter ATP-binding protein [Geodermatophilus africanus]SDX83485.1 NitT/TauT family transport system ATP-binding protein [Geodermatophilus africanus]